MTACSVAAGKRNRRRIECRAVADDARTAVWSRVQQPVTCGGRETLELIGAMAELLEIHGTASSGMTRRSSPASPDREPESRRRRSAEWRRHRREHSAQLRDAATPRVTARRCGPWSWLRIRDAGRDIRRRAGRTPAAESEERGIADAIARSIGDDPASARRSSRSSPARVWLRRSACDCAVADVVVALRTPSTRLSARRLRATCGGRPTRPQTAASRCG